MSPSHDERPHADGHGANLRVKAGHSDGALTIVGLGADAGVPRNALTQRHVDLNHLIHEGVQANARHPTARDASGARQPN